MAINTKPIWELPTYDGNMPSDNDIIPIIDVDGDAHDSNTWKPEDGYENAKTRKMTIGSVKEQMLNMTGRAIAQWGRTMMESLTGYSPDKVTPTPENTSGNSAVKETALAFLLNHIYTYLNDKDHKIVDLNGVYDWLLSAFTTNDFNFIDVWDQYFNTDEDGLLGQMRDAAAEGTLGLNNDVMHLLSPLLLSLFDSSLFRQVQGIDDDGNIIVSGYFYHKGVDPSTTATDTLDLTDFGAYIPNDIDPGRAPWSFARVGSAEFNPTLDKDNGSKKINKMSVKGGFLDIEVANQYTFLTSSFSGTRERKRYFLINDWEQNQGPLYAERIARVFRPSIEHHQVSVTEPQLTSVWFKLNTSESIPSISNTQVAFGTDASDPVPCDQFSKLSFEVLAYGKHGKPASARWVMSRLFTDGDPAGPNEKSMKMFKLQGFNDKYKLERFTKPGESTVYIRPDDVDSMSQMYALSHYAHEDQPAYLHEARYITNSWDYWWTDSDNVTQINSYSIADPTRVVDDFQSMVCFISNTDSYDKRYVLNVPGIIATVALAWADTYTQEQDAVYNLDRIEPSGTYPTIYYVKEGETAFPINQVYVDDGDPVPTVTGLALTTAAISFEDASVVNNTPFLKAVSWYGWDLANLPELLDPRVSYDWGVSAPGTNVVWSYNETTSVWSIEFKYVERAEFRLFPRVADQTTEDPIIRQAISDNIVMFDGEHYAVHPYIYTAGTSTTTLLDQTYWANWLKNMSTVEFGLWVIGGAISSIKNLLSGEEDK